MFKKVFLICLSAIVTISAMAQVTVNRGAYVSQQNDDSFKETRTSAFVMKYGVKAGVNLSTMTNAMAFDPAFSMGVGFRVGGFLNMRWGQRTENSLPGTGLWGFQPELLYSYQSVGTESGNLGMNLVSIPLMLKIYPSIGFSVELGPEMSYLAATSPNTMALGGAQVNVGECSGLMFGLAGGLAYDFEFGLTVGARYTYGLTDLAKNLKWKNNNVQITLGWLF